MNAVHPSSPWLNPPTFLEDPLSFSRALVFLRHAQASTTPNAAIPARVPPSFTGWSAWPVWARLTSRCGKLSTGKIILSR